MIRKNRERAQRLGLRNISFNTVCLPKVPKQHGFDFALCVATLHYFHKNLGAIRNLYRILRPGGVLIFNYPNRYTVSWYRKNTEESMKRRFALLIFGSNTLTRKMIETVVGTPCHNFWQEMGETASRANPCLYVRRLETSCLKG